MDCLATFHFEQIAAASGKTVMSDLIDKFRRDHANAPVAGPRRWPLALVGLAGLVIAGLIGLQVAGVTLAPAISDGSAYQDSTLALRPTLNGQANTADPSTTGSTSAMNASKRLLQADSDWPALLYVLGVSGLTGLMVFYIFNTLLATNSNPDAGEYQVPGRLKGHRIEDRSEVRRWHGGPIRN